MLRLQQRIAKLHFAKGAPFDKCMGEKCSKAPEVECIWAEGRGRAWHCEKCHSKWVKENEDSEGEEGWLPVAIVKQRKVPNGTVGEKYGEYPETKKAKDSRTGPGYKVGLFLPLPGSLAKKFPALGSYDATPSHITFLHIGAVKGTEEQARLLKILREIFQRRWPKCKASLGGLEVFPEPDHQVVSVGVTFNKDLFALWRQVKKDLVDAGFKVPDKHPDFKPHVTLKRIDLEDEYQGRVPRGTWGFDEMEVWGLPKVHKIKFGPCPVPRKSARDIMAKATGDKEWGGDSVGLFIPLPKRLAKKFPSLGDEDTSPSHVTFLYIGTIKDRKEQEHLIKTLRDVHGKWWPEVTATLDGLDHFEHPDKDRRVAHVKIDFDKDLSGMRHRVKQALQDGGIQVDDSFPEYKPHTTLAYMPGSDHPDYDGEVPEGTWKFKGMEIWGLPKVHRIKFGPSFYKVSEGWLAKRALEHYMPKIATRIATQWLHKKATWAVYAGAHDRSIALMKWLSEATRKLGVSRDTYVVGGAVRNFLIDQPIKDIDVVFDSVAAGKDSDWLAEKLSRMIPVPTNVTTNQYGVAILSVKGEWVLDGEDMKGEVIEIANARKESYGGAEGKGYKPSEVEPATIKEDLLRREFTFNTLLWRLSDLASGPEKAEIIDLTGCGMRDLKEGILACPSDPDKTFSDDPTRILRAIKFTGKYGFKIPPDLAKAIKRNAPKMKRMPWEAIGKILVDNILKEPTARKSLKQMKDLGILDVVSEMIKTTPPFKTYMAGQFKKNRNVALLLDMMDLGVPSNTPLTGLKMDPKQMQRFREITIGMDESDAGKFLDALISPPIDNRVIFETLNLQGPDRGKMKPAAQVLLLQDPALTTNPRKLTDLVIRELR